MLKEIVILCQQMTVGIRYEAIKIVRHTVAAWNVVKIFNRLILLRSSLFLSKTVHNLILYLFVH